MKSIKVIGAKGHNLKNITVEIPKDKIISRYNRALKLIPELVDVCDILHIYDNTEEPYRIFKKRKDVYYRWNNEFWDNDEIEKLTGIINYNN